MTEDEIRRIAEGSARIAVREVLESLGLDITEKLEVQRQMAALRSLTHLVNDDEYRADMVHLRRWRTAIDGIGKMGATATITILLSGIAAALWMGIKEILKR